MTRLEDREEATMLAEEAKGRKALFRFTFDSALNSNFLLPWISQCQNRHLSTKPFQSDLADFLRKILEISKEIKGIFKILEAFKAVFRDEGGSAVQIKADTMRLLQIVLTIISLKHPHQAKKASTQANLPLLGFKTPDEVVSYLDAVIRSGTSADEKSGTVFLMGNTEHHVLSY